MKQAGSQHEVIIFTGELMGTAAERTVLRAVAAAVEGPDAWVGPLRLDCSVLHHTLPAEELPLAQVRALLLRSGAPYEARNAVWAELAFLSQHHGEEWELGAIWMMSPGLRKAAWRVVGDSRVPYADIETEVVEGFLCELRTTDIEVPAIAAKLWWAGYRHGLRAREAYRPTARRTEISDLSSLRPHGTSDGHPDFVLERAVREGAITGGEAELIGSTRLEECSLAAAAVRLDLGYQACRARRAAAEERLARFLVITDPRLDNPPEQWSQTNREAA
jgi:hypothetical protein